MYWGRDRTRADCILLSLTGLTNCGHSVRPAQEEVERGTLGLTTDEFLKPGVEFAIHRYASILIAGYAGGPAPGKLIFALNNFVLCVGYIESKRHQQVSGNSFLHGDSSAGIGVIATESRINGKAGKPGKLLDTTADFAGGALGEERRRAKVGGRVGSLLGSLSTRD